MSRRSISPHGLLRKHLIRKQKTHPSYSIRALARDIGVSPSYMNSVFSGKKPLPQKRLREIAKRLDIDSVGLIVLKKSMAYNKITTEEQDLIRAEVIENGKESSINFIEKFKEESANHLALWSHWYYIAILDLSTTITFKVDPVWIAKKLAIETRQASAALNFLIQQKYLVEKNGRLQKADFLLRMPARKPNQTIREFHTQLMIKAIKTMRENQSQDDYDRRLITGIILAADSRKIPEAKKRLNLFIHDLAEFLCTEETDQVFQLGVQLFPLCKD